MTQYCTFASFRDSFFLLLLFLGIKAKLEIAESSLQAQSNLVAEKEKEIARKVQAVREEEWGKVSQLETEKYDVKLICLLVYRYGQLLGCTHGLHFPLGT